jgi:NADH-quinone oxidoreductase subunit H
MYFTLFIIIISILTFFVPLLISIALLTLIERKVLAAIQKRRGPNKRGFLGLLQPFSDGFKLLLKQPLLPLVANKFIYFLSPIITFSLSLFVWFVIPFDFFHVFVDLDLSILYILAFSSLTTYGLILAGWSSNSRYAFLGSIRSIAQMLSYEVFSGLVIINVILLTGSVNVTEVVLAQSSLWFVIPLFPLFIIHFIAVLAETNRPPFDLPESESELVAGYHTEFSSITFALFFLGEYSNIIFTSALLTLFYFGGWLPIVPSTLFYLPGFFWFIFKFSFFVFVFIWIRATVPRYRYDQLIRLGWKYSMPVSLAWLIFLASYFYFFHF